MRIQRAMGGQRPPKSGRGASRVGEEGGGVGGRGGERATSNIDSVIKHPEFSSGLKSDPA